MKLTNQMRAEIVTIHTRNNQINEEFVDPLRREIVRDGGISAVSLKYTYAIIGELDSYKVRVENILCETDIKIERLEILKLLLHILQLVDDCNSLLFNEMSASLDDQERYLKMGMKIDSRDPNILYSYGNHLEQKQSHSGHAEIDYGYIEYYRKAMAASGDSLHKEELLIKIHNEEAERDFFTSSLMPIKHLIQIGEPNLEIMEPKWELYKISISFRAHVPNDVPKLKGYNHRVLLQNAEGNINMGVFYNDPDIEMDQIFWYNQLAGTMHDSLRRNEGLISVEDFEEFKTQSCYVELHSHPVGANGRNNIIAVTPMKFLPIKEFEKRQKSINPNQTRAIMSSAMTQIPDVIENKKKASILKEKGNDAFKRKKYKVAEKFYSDALELNLDSRPVWTNRAICRNTMKKHDDALADCLSALSIDPNNTKTITQKGNAHLGLGQFDEAKKCYESLHELGERDSADRYLKKLAETEKPSKPAIKPLV